MTGWAVLGVPLGLFVGLALGALLDTLDFRRTERRGRGRR